MQEQEEGGVGEEVGRAKEGRKQGGLLEQGPGGAAGGWPGQRLSPGKGGHWSEGRAIGPGQGFWSHLLPRYVGARGGRHC